MQMVSTLFYIGLVFIAINLVMIPYRGIAKPELVAMPFALFAAAATGRFLGM